MGKKDKYAAKKKVAEPEPKVENVADPSTSAETPKETPVPPVPQIIKTPGPSEGAQGRKQLVEVNYFKMAAEKLIKETFHYDLEMTPVASRKFTAMAVEIFMKTYFKDAAYGFDGKKNLYTDRKLNVDVKQENVSIKVDESTVKEYSIKLQFTENGRIDLNILKNYKHAPEGENFAKALACVDIILKSRFRNTNALPFARSHYFPTRIPLNPGMELWRGLYQSTVMGMTSLYLNADVLNKAVPSEMTVLQYFKEITKNRDGPPTSLQPWHGSIANEHFKGLRIIYYHQKLKDPSRKTASGLGSSANEQTFVLENKGKMTVAQYFGSIGIKLKYPNLPTILISSVDPKTKNVRKTYLPAEFCKIPGAQLNQKKVTDACLQVMIKETAQPTFMRKDLIQGICRNYPLNDDTKKFGIEIATEFAKVMARIINSPKIIYNRKEEIPNDKNGAWRDGNFLAASKKPMKLAVVSCERISIQVLQNVKTEFLAAAASRQMDLQDSPGNVFTTVENLIAPGALKDFLSENLNQCKLKGFNFVIVIITDDKCYSMVKKVSESQVGILTQCLKSRHFYERQNYKAIHHSTMKNIFLKINAKLNGTNNRVDEPVYKSIVEQATVMFIGADVTHPTSDSRGTEPSVAAVCASYDRFGLKYNQEWRLQKSGSDLIDDFEDMMIKHLEFFWIQSKNMHGKETLPSKIIYYRDGVGDSQFETFLGPETASLKRACEEVYKRKKIPVPKITLIVVNKRHHMRAFPIDKESGDGSRFNNILPGTIVDKDIVDARYFQFFLASHSALQGCTRPAKYTVLLNECGIKVDDLQKLTYVLCHMYVRCNRSVSYPNCTYYAHLMAFRGKHYMGGEKLDMEDLKGESQRLNNALKTFVSSAHPMFFV